MTEQSTEVPQGAPKLRPCPFCGGTDVQVRENGRQWLGMKYGEPASVSILHWCPSVPGQPGRAIERVGRDHASAVAAWNQRAPAENQAAVDSIIRGQIRRAAP